MEKIGYLGLGVMGYGMTSNLIDKYDGPIYGYDPAPEAMGRFLSRGGIGVTNPEEIYQNCSIILLCLPTNALVQSTVERILELAQPGTTIADMGATAPHIIRELHQKAMERGIHLLDAPVSGGASGAAAGTLAIMCGGERDVFERMKPYLQMMGGTVTYVGESGCGDVAKLANNMIVNIGLMTAGEAFAFAKKAGVDARTLLEAMRGGVAETAILKLRAPTILNRAFVPASARMTIAMKDAVNALDLADDLGVDLPLTRLLVDRYRWMLDAGLEEEDHSAIVKYYEDAMGVTIS